MRASPSVRECLATPSSTLILPIIHRRKDEAVHRATAGFSGSSAAGAMWSSTCLYDRGTVFGLKTSGRGGVDPHVAAGRGCAAGLYDYQPEPGVRREAELYGGVHLEAAPNYGREEG